MDDRGDPCERGIGLEAEAREQRLERHAVADVAEGRAVEVEAERALRAFRRRREPAEARLRVDEAADQPGAGDAVDPQATPRRPRAALVLRALEPRHAAAPCRAARRARAGRRCAARARATRRRPRRSPRREEVDRAHRIELALQPFSAGARARSARARPGRGSPPSRCAAARRSRRCDRRAGGTRAFLAVARMHGHQPGVAAFARALVGQLLQSLLPRVARGQQIGTVAQRAATDRLQRAPDAHARGRALGRQRDDEEQPVGCRLPRSRSIAATPRFM